MTKVGALWDSSSGLGAPVFLAEVPPFHPLAIAARLLAGGSAEFVGFSAALLVGFCSYIALRQFRTGKVASAVMTVAISVAVAVAGPSQALLILGVVSSLAALGWFLLFPSRTRWSMFVAVTAVAIVGDSIGVLPFLLLPCGALFAALLTHRRSVKQWAGTISGALLGAVLATVLSAFWWFPLSQLRTGHRPAVPPSVVAEPLFLAKRFVVDPEATTAFNGYPGLATVDHIPAKIRRMSAELDSALAGRPVITRGGDVSVRSGPERSLRLLVRSEGWNLLVTNLAWYPGWRVYWNGERMPPVTVNGALVGTFIPPGRGELWLRYRPREFDTGLRLGLVALAVMLLTARWPWFLRIPTPATLISPRVPPIIRRVASRTSRILLSRRSWAVAVALLFAGYAFVIFKDRVRIAGGSDSSGYLNQARMWTRGELAVPITLLEELRLPPEYSTVFTPLGFVSGPRAGTMVPTYPPGVPLLMAGLRRVGGDWAMFLFGPIAALITLLLMVQLGREVGLSTGLSIAGAAILAVFPPFLLNAIYPVSDVAATGWAIATLVAAFRSARDPRWGLVAGVLAGFGVLLRPSQVFLLPALLVAARFRPRAVVGMILGGLPFTVIQMSLAYQLFGDPFRTGYGSTESLLLLSNFPPRFLHYGYWLGALLTPVIFPVGLFAVFIPRLDRFVRFSLAGWFVMLFLFYCFYSPYEGWGYTRFILPAVPALIVLTLLAAESLLAGLPAGPRRVSLAAVLILVIGAGAWHSRGFHILSANEGQKVYVEATLGAQRLLPPNALVMGMEMSGAHYYYLGKTVVRWDGLTPDRFTVVRTHASIQGRKWYAVLSPYEIQDAMRNAPGNWVPIARFRDVTLFELR